MKFSKIVTGVVTLLLLNACGSGSGINGPFEVRGYTSPPPPPSPPLPPLPPPPPPPPPPPEVTPGSYTLEFDSLPSDQGWVYSGYPLREGDVFSVDGTRLAQTMLGKGNDANAEYRRTNVAISSVEMILSLTARVVGYERLMGRTSGYVFAFFINDGTFVHRLAFTDKDLKVHDQYLPLDTTISRDYVLEMHPGGGFELHVDGDLLATGVTYERNSNLNFIAFGDHSSDENIDIEITALSLTVGIDRVAIDIEPSSGVNSVDLHLRKSLPVVILTTDTFDAVQVDWETVKFGPAGATESHGSSHVEDVDNDGDPDLVLHFNTGETGLACGDTTATLSGDTFSGEPVTASDVIRTVNCPQ